LYARSCATYSDTGQPSIDPEVLLRILLIGYLCERKLFDITGGQVST
jgi:hypothetical protein